MICVFDKMRCINNIYALSKERGVKIGDIEEKAGMSKGYLSRVSKPDYQGSPSIEMLDSIAEQLGVGIDFLVNYSPETLSVNEQFVMEFIDKLIQQTFSGKVEWLKETTDVLAGENKIEAVNPLVNVGKAYSDEISGFYDTHEYNSLFYEKGAKVSDTCYYAELSIVGAKVFLNKVAYMSAKKTEFGTEHLPGVIEVYLYDKNVQPVCSTFYVGEELKKQINSLYQAADSSTSKIALSHKVKSMMDTYLKYTDN